KNEHARYMYYDTVKNGFEGIIIKSNDNRALKLKRIKTADCIITGFTKGKGKYSGLVGAIEVSVLDPDNKPVGNLTEFTKEQVDTIYEVYGLINVGQISGFDDAF